MYKKYLKKKFSDILNYNIINQCNKISIKNLFEIQIVYQLILTSLMAIMCLSTQILNIHIKKHPSSVHNTTNNTKVVREKNLFQIHKTSCLDAVHSYNT